MDKETYIVTGATGGIGRAIVEGLISRGVGRVIMACRNVDRGRRMADELASGMTELVVMKLDLESFTSVRDFASTLLESGQRIKALINNAGTMPGEMKLTDDGYESATQVNYLSTCLLSELLSPAIMRGGAILFTTSMTRHIARLHNDWASRAVKHHNRFVTYGRSKLMLTHYALDMSARLAGREIYVNCSDPGIVDSPIISMDNKVIDFLSDKLFRPLIRSTAKGAEPVLEALDKCVTSNIFTPGKCRPMSARYLYQKNHHLAVDPISALMRDALFSTTTAIK
ncbi:MAG: SDR family NAD(P)-dependent oxidoreductase [Muribaculum sp.]|nr:SDR family NAD(P)-dependent oxidoreductase [Muribaculum sp.]